MTLEAFRARFPWPDSRSADPARAPAPRLVDALWRYELNVTPDQLWPHLVDTSRLNRSMNLPAMKFEERDGKLHGRASYGGRVHTWVEEPWDWVSQRYMTSTRTYERGFGFQSYTVFELCPRPEGGTVLYVYIGWLARSWLSARLVSFGLRSMRRGFDAAVARMAATSAHARRALTGGDAGPAIDPVASAGADPAPGSAANAAPVLGPDAERRLREARTRLLRAARDRHRGADAGAGASTRPDRASTDADASPETLIDRLLDLVRNGDEIELARIQVRALARDLSVDEHELLLTCLHATRAGVLIMSWDVVCPHCRGVRREARNLGDVPTLGECDVCEIDFATDKRNAIEITFRVHPAVRDIPKRYFCSAEAATKTHIQLQHQLAPGRQVTLRTALRPGRYRLRLHGEKRYRFLDVSEMWEREGEGMHAGTKPLIWRSGDTGDLSCGERPDVVLENLSDAPQRFIIERAAWSDVALRPSRLFTMQEFRDLFSEEYLAADVQLAVGEQTILFTDIVGSTRFYARSGDPDAFIAVKKHFNVIYDCIGRCHGAVVKTIGDAAMGAFETPLDALEAARQIQDYFTPDQRETPIRVRISLNHGPCIAVNLNSNIDYFGTTVNLAAKLQRCAEAGDIAMSRTVVDAAGVQDYLRPAKSHLEALTVPIEALGKELEVLVWHRQGPPSRRRQRGSGEAQLRL